jgi:hypothetical protein
MGRARGRRAEQGDAPVAVGRGPSAVGCRTRSATRAELNTTLVDPSNQSGVRLGVGFEVVVG